METIIFHSLLFLSACRSSFTPIFLFIVIIIVAELQNETKKKYCASVEFCTVLASIYIFFSPFSCYCCSLSLFFALSIACSLYLPFIFTSCLYTKFLLCVCVCASFFLAVPFIFANPFGSNVQKLMNFTLSMIRKFCWIESFSLFFLR